MRESTEVSAAAIRELPPSAKVRVLTWNREFPPEAAAALRSLPGAIVVRIAPCDWCVVCEATDEDPDGDECLRAGCQVVAAADPSVRAIDISHALCAIEVAGPRAHELLEKGCGVDLDLAAFPVGDSTGTRFAGVAAILLRTSDDAFRSYVARSHRDYVISWLNDAAAEWRGA